MTSRTNRLETAAAVRRFGAHRPCRQAGVMAWPGILVMAIAGLVTGAPSAVSAEPGGGLELVVNQQVEQTRRRFQSAVSAELELVRRTCGSLAKASRPDIVAAAGRGLERAAWEDWCRRAAASKMRIAPGWNGRSLDPDPWWQP